ncbi:MAG: CocE/NonD family hydrolase [Proteobacteria bacterium]|nr:CocE/NonD family hydrolase [Pseudomonadota bacterium]MBU4472238.1 CocE/NonD family hydrolase [Pseudomonadota bacterium]MCG2750447.1 CocE/NonD family hydrolase [Desulfobacteraceae bacterium]
MIKSIRMDRDIPMEMRDGVVLRADVFRPDDQEKHPAIIVRTPYDKGPSTRSDFFSPTEGAFAGYAVVIQDTRGRFASEGEWVSGASEGLDGYDTVECVANSSWCDGNVGMAGASYLGRNQWDAAQEAPPHLKAIAPHVISAGKLSEFRRAGLIDLESAISWSTAMAVDTLTKLAKKGVDVSKMAEAVKYASENTEEACGFLPLKDLPLFQFEELGKGAMQRMGDIPEGIKTEEDIYWAYKKVQVPCMHAGGWYDMFCGDTFLNFLNMRTIGGSPIARQGQHVLMGPWLHGSRLHNLVGGCNFGRYATGPGSFATARHIAFFDKYLRGIDSKYLVPVRYFVMGIKKWKNADTWPLPQTDWQRFYFHSRGHANSLTGDGVLSRNEPGNEPPDRYIYNPLDPVPSRGGRINPDMNIPAGPLDQTLVEQRNDVLCYTTPELKEPLEVTGPVKLHLFAATSAVDTDFIAKLVDVHPNGLSINIAEGFLRARYRKSILGPEAVNPGQINEYIIDLASTSIVFGQGHRIRVHITSSEFPRFDRNMNTGNPIGEDAQGVPAMQTIFHQKDYASHIELPVIPK